MGGRQAESGVALGAVTKKKKKKKKKKKNLKSNDLHFRRLLTVWKPYQWYWSPRVARSLQSFTVFQTNGRRMNPRSSR